MKKCFLSLVSRNCILRNRASLFPLGMIERAFSANCCAYRNGGFVIMSPFQWVLSMARKSVSGVPKLRFMRSDDLPWILCFISTLDRCPCPQAGSHTFENFRV